jgi:hypothetical protein
VTVSGVRSLKLGLELMIWDLSVGLIIISAHYGLATAFTETGLREIKGQEGKILDVTVQTQALVNAGKLQISGGRSKVSSFSITSWLLFYYLDTS